jgi:hypothetical protein
VASNTYGCKPPNYNKPTRSHLIEPPY